MTDRIPFGRLAHLLTVPVRVGDGPPLPFVLDTGIGVTLLASRVCARLGLARTGAAFRGRRMSGQSVSVPLVRAPALALGSHRWKDVVAGEIDLGTLAPPLAALGGFLSLGLFETLPLAIDYASGQVVLDPAADPGAGLGAEVDAPLRLERNGPSVTAFLELLLPDGRPASVEVDTGSESLILHRRYLAGLGLSEEDPRVRRESGTDETGHAHVRWFAPLRGSVRVAVAPEIAQEEPPAMFQEIVYDGLVGDAFLRRWTVTFDLARSSLRFSRPIFPG